MGQFGSHRPPQDIAFAPARSIAQAVSVSLASSTAAMGRVGKSRDCPVEPTGAGDASIVLVCP
ncbi:hypothetical protein HaLaN_32743, partial [Haematococcus lacustris]